MITISDLPDILKALSDETRLKLVELLLKHDYCVGALAKRLNITESAVSQHLKILRVADIVKGDKRGYFTHYYVDRDILKATAKQIIALSEIQQSNTGCCEPHSKQSCCKCKGE